MPRSSAQNFFQTTHSSVNSTEELTKILKALFKSAAGLVGNINIWHAFMLFSILSRSGAFAHTQYFQENNTNTVIKFEFDLDNIPEDYNATYLTNAVETCGLETLKFSDNTFHNEDYSISLTSTQALPATVQQCLQGGLSAAVKEMDQDLQANGKADLLVAVLLLGTASVVGLIIYICLYHQRLRNFFCPPNPIQAPPIQAPNETQPLLNAEINGDQKASEKISVIPTHYKKPLSFSERLEKITETHGEKAKDFIEKNIPTKLICPISREIPNDPIVAKTGIFYGKQSLLQALKIKQECPTTRKKITTKEIMDTDICPYINADIENFVKEMEEKYATKEKKLSAELKEVLVDPPESGSDSENEEALVRKQPVSSFGLFDERHSDATIPVEDVSNSDGCYLLGQK